MILRRFIQGLISSFLHTFTSILFNKIFDHFYMSVNIVGDGLSGLQKLKLTEVS